MAANSSSRGIASLGKRLINEIRARDSAQLSALTLRRAAHTSTYDKNPEEQTQASFVPDDVIPPQPDKYWAPHPDTGVFGPEAEHTSSAGREDGSSPGDGGEGSSVLEQKAWFRPTSIEDLEKPHLP
ncbi:late embryogenesis abundant protein At5g17165-like [Pyrus communis]|uniref:late embryogenesis abundant protein At5g17165-like n=1 Tax=Pyrus communis TaxID=23211 RepID=UPI0035C1692D